VPKKSLEPTPFHEAQRCRKAGRKMIQGEAVHEEEPVEESRVSI
jgi:hypothetical protein